MDVKEQLERHVEETYGEEVYCMYPEGHAGDVLGTELTNAEAEFYVCPECGHNTRFHQRADGKITQLKCESCGVLGPVEGHLVSYPIVRCILSEQRVLNTIRERLAPDYPDEDELADEVLSEFCHNTSGGFYGAETPLFIDEFVKE